MSVYFAAVLAFAGCLWLYNYRRQKRLDADQGQHHLASLLVAAASGHAGLGAQAVRDHLASLTPSLAERRVRLNHAAMLLRSKADPQLYERVLKVVRGL